MNGRKGWAVAASFLLAAAAAADDAALLRPGEKLTTTFAATGARKTVGFAGVAGTKLEIDAQAAKGSRVVPKISLLDPDGAAVDVGDTNPKSGPKARCKGLVLGTTGVWRIGVDTPREAGGAFTLTTKATVPAKFALSGSLAAADATADVFFDAAPGGTATVALAAKGKPTFDPHVQVIAPSGAVVAEATGAKGRVQVKNAALPELGRYVVRVSGGVGVFVGSVAVKAAKKTTPDYHEVEARPAVRGFSPTTVDNDSVVTFDLDGFAFSTQQNVVVLAGARAVAAPIKAATLLGATADLDLVDVPPGTYQFQVSTPEGHATVAPGTLVVKNRKLAVGSVTPAEVGSQQPIALDVRGAGFDAGSVLSVKRQSDGLSVPLTVTSRIGRTGFLATLNRPPYETGVHDVEVRDPDGSTGVKVGGIDLLGYAKTPATLRTYVGGVDSWYRSWFRDAAYDATNGHVLLSMSEGTNLCVFLLVDPAGPTLLDTVTFTNTEINTPRWPRVAWNPKDGTFAMTCVGGAGGGAYCRIVSAQNIRTTIAAGKPVASGTTYQLHAAPNPDAGGYLLVWDEHGSPASKLRTQVVPTGGQINGLASKTIGTHAQGYQWTPVAAYDGGGRFFLAWIGAANLDTQYAVWNSVVDAAGDVTAYGPYTTATSPNWYNLFQPELAVRPDGMMLLAYTYLDVTDTATYRPACQPLEAFSAVPGDYHALDADSHLPEGYLDSLVWNPNRQEFIITLSTLANHVAVRRVNPDGSMRPVQALEQYEGQWGILYTSSAPGTLGLAMTWDGLADDIGYTATTTMKGIAAPLR